MEFGNYLVKTTVGIINLLSINLLKAQVESANLKKKKKNVSFGEKKKEGGGKHQISQKGLYARIRWFFRRIDKAM